MIKEKGIDAPVKEGIYLTYDELVGLAKWIRFEDVLIDNTNWLNRMTRRLHKVDGTSLPVVDISKIAYRLKRTKEFGVTALSDRLEKIFLSEFLEFGDVAREESHSSVSVGPNNGDPSGGFVQG